MNVNSKNKKYHVHHYWGENANGKKTPPTHQPRSALNTLKKEKDKIALENPRHWH